MKDLIRQNIIALGKASPLLQEEIDRIDKDWHPSEPPITLMYGEIGAAIAENVDRMDGLGRIFAIVEEGFSAQDPDLSNAVGAGLIEAVVSAASHDERLWNRLLAEMGKKTKEYAIIYRG